MLFSKPKVDPLLEAMREVNKVKEMIDVNLEYLHDAIAYADLKYAEKIKDDLDTLHKELNKAQEKLRIVKNK